ncbi:MAG: glycosyltransferase family 2 protein [Candidatus Peregrinibacteria bacterium]|nr:glycosyltransferase family 2 protein [Candidatus Peregrinibacteria bacterium]
MTLSPHPIVSAIVLNYRTPKEAVRCVQALLKQTIADRISIIVVDNHSEDDSIGTLRNRLSHFPNVRILESRENVGYARGNAVAIAQATGEYLLIINPDNELSPASVAAMIERLRRDSTIGIVAPKLVHDDGSVRSSARSFPSLFDVLIKRSPLQSLFPRKMERYLHARALPNREREVDWVVGTCMLMERSLYKHLGGFDERFFLFFEDMDLCRRCRKAGKRVVYFPEAVALDRKHRLSEGGPLSLITKRVGRAHIASAMRYFWKWRNVDLDLD